MVFINTPKNITTIQNTTRILINKTKYQPTKTPSNKQLTASAYRPRQKGNQTGTAYRPRHKGHQMGPAYRPLHKRNQMGSAYRPRHKNSHMVSVYRPRQKKLKILNYMSRYQTKQPKKLKSYTFNTLNKITKPTRETQPILGYQPLHKPHPTPYPHTKHNRHPHYKTCKNQKMTVIYRSHRKSSLKNHITTKRKPHTITKHIPQTHLHMRLLIRHNTRQNHISQLINHPYPKLKPHNKYILHPKNKVALAYRLHYPTKNKCHVQNKHPTFKHQSRLKYQLKLNSHEKYKHHPKNSMASAHRPRNTNNNTYYLINKWKPTSVTNQIHINNIKLHFSPKQVKNNLPAIPNLFTTTKLKIIIYLNTNKRKPKLLHFNGYYFINILELLKCGDIEPNPGSMPNILHTHPAAHKKRANIYFIPNIIKLQPEYQHIAKTFAPILKNTHPLHLQAITTHRHLYQYIQTQRQTPLTHMLYALIITIHPSIDTCNNILAQPQNYHFNDIWTNTLLLD